MEPTVPTAVEAKPISRGRWWIHLIVITSYLLTALVVGLFRNQPDHPALSSSASGLVVVCGFQLLAFGVFFGVSWWASRATVDDLLLRWRGNVMPVVFGALYSIGLRIAVGVIFACVAAVVAILQIVDMSKLMKFIADNKPAVDKTVDIAALTNNPAYYWLALTLVSFVVAGLREELWRSSFLAGLKALWPRQFGSRFGQIWAVVIAAILFGSAHIAMGIIAAVMAGVLGLGLGLIMIFHRSIWPAVIAHGFFDATTMALLPWANEMMHHLKVQ